MGESARRVWWLSYEMHEAAKVGRALLDSPLQALSALSEGCTTGVQALQATL